jgi:hypothetical protein
MKKRYCSARCRTEAYRDRQALAVEAEDTPQPPPAVVQAQTREVLLEVADAIIADVEAADPADRLARAIVETRVLAKGYSRLAPELPPGLAWRASDMSAVLDRSVDRLFGAPDE